MSDTRKPGIHREALTVHLEEEGKVSIPYFILQGKEPGPTLYAQAGEHGIEVGGMAALHTLVRTFDPNEYRGRLIVVPIVNPLNVRYRHHTKYQPRGCGYSYYMPYNTFKRWPGKEEGDPAQRICHAITTTLLRDLCGVLNFHCWSWHSASCAFMSGWGGPQESELGRILGIPFMMSYPSLPERPSTNTTLQEYAGARMNIPACLVELRTHWWISEESHSRGVRAVRNACRFFGMRKDPFEVESRQFHVADSVKETRVVAPHDGLYVPRVGIETNVTKGSALGDLYDIDEGKTTPILSPVNGVLWLNNRVGERPDLLYEDGHAFAKQGDLLALIK